MLFWFIYCVIITQTIGIVASESCPAVCSCEESFVICENVDLIPMGLPTTTAFLSLPQNRIKTISQEDFQGLAESLQQLDLSGGELEKIAAGTFSNMKNLVTLDLSKTNLKSVDNGAFSGLVSLQNLDLSSTKLKNLLESPFQDLNSLKMLNLKENKELTQISASAFNGLESLEELFLGGSDRLRYIPKKAMSTLHSLNHLVLEDLSLNSLTPASFPKLDTLERLCIEKWKNLQRIAADTFKPLTNLTELMIKSTSLQEIPSSALAQLRKLRKLTMDDNTGIKILHRNDFFGLANLRELSLVNIGLHNLQESPFHSNDHLNTLDLSQNELSAFPAHTVFSLFELETLNISHNHLTMLGPITFENNQQLHLVDVSNNSMICDCDLSWLKLWQLVNMKEHQLIGECASPHTHAGIQISAIEQKYFVCKPPRFKEHNVTVSVSVGNSLTLDCKPGQGSPDPTITWTDGHGTMLTKYDEIGKVDPPPHIWQLQNGSLFFNSTLDSDYGTFRCTAENKEGKSLKTFALTYPGLSDIFGDATPSGGSVATGILVTIGLLLPVGGVLWYIRKRREYKNLNDSERWNTL
uniref:leucine-rich repeat and immunoglobulin-like domain-containing nogo receptor-interacting protein 2 n=1 Tax=Styela clava TaxID=7725 RepID=UPI001939E684|nr:leucine-rich repeat and immunoglobulin-like domain-containing nogo receptor-interacting protein 2 [Styela clava]